MKKLKIIGTLALSSVLIGQRFFALPDLALGLGYGIVIGTLILSCIPKEKYEQIKSYKKSLFTR